MNAMRVLSSAFISLIESYSYTRDIDKARNGTDANGHANGNAKPMLTISNNRRKWLIAEPNDNGKHYANINPKQLQGRMGHRGQQLFMLTVVLRGKAKQ